MACAGTQVLLFSVVLTTMTMDQDPLARARGVHRIPNVGFL